MTTLRFTENQVEQGGYDFSELVEDEPITCAVRRSTYFNVETDQVVTEITIERVK